jgi:hypothetical protein
MTGDSDPYDPELDRLLNEYATSVGEQSARVPANRRRKRPARRAIRWGVHAFTPALALLLGGVTVVAAATGGFIAFGWPAIAPGPAETAPPPASIGAPVLGGVASPGRIFAVDGSDVAEPAAVVLIDPSEKRVVSRFPTGLDPDIAISSDGGILYVAESDGSRSTVRAIDTRAGSDLFKIPFPDRMMHTLPPVRSGLALSDDGRWLFAATLRISQPGQDSTGLVALDTSTHAWTKGIDLGSCLSPWLVAQQSGVTAACPHDGRVFDVAASGDGLVVTRSTQSGSSLPAVASDSSGLALVTDDGEWRQSMNATQAVIADKTIDDNEEVWQGGLVVVPEGAVIASRVGLDPQGATELSLFDKAGAFVTSRSFDQQPIWSLSNAGEQFIATSGGALLLLDGSLKTLESIAAGSFLSQPMMVLSTN